MTHTLTVRDVPSQLCPGVGGKVGADRAKALRELVDDNPDTWWRIYHDAKATSQKARRLRERGYTVAVANTAPQHGDVFISGGHAPAVTNWQGVALDMGPKEPDLTAVPYIMDRRARGVPAEGHDQPQDPYRQALAEVLADSLLTPGQRMARRFKQLHNKGQAS